MKAMIKRLFACLREYKKYAHITFALMVLEVFIEVLIPFITAGLVNNIKAGVSMGELTKTGLLLIFLALASLSCGASGGYTSARKEIVALLRQRSRPYLFSNTLAPAICAATLQTIKLLNESTALRDKVHANAAYFRQEMEKLGFDLLPGEHPIVPVMLYDARIAHEFSRRMLDKGVYVVAFCYPVVPKGKDRIRTQISAGHSKEDIDFAVKAFGEVKKEMGL